MRDWPGHVLGTDAPIIEPRRVERVDAGDGAVDQPTAVLRDDSTVTTLAWDGRATAPTLVFDFGRVIGGFVEIALGEESAPFDVFYSETLRHLGTGGDYRGFGGPDRCPGSATAETWRCSRLSGGFRYLGVRSAEPGRVSLRSLRVHWASPPCGPASLTGRFACSDDGITRLWHAAGYTTHINVTAPGVAAHPGATATTRGWVLDGPKRDRLYWTGDLLVEAPALYLTLDAADAVRHCLEAPAADQHEDGYVPVFGPEAPRPLRWLSYVAAWIHVIALHELYTGDPDIVRELWSAVNRAVGYLERFIDPADGLIVSDPFETWTWHSPPIPGKEAGTNVLVEQGVRAAASMAGALGDRASGARWFGVADRMRAGINQVLWSERLGAYVVSELFPDAVPQDANALAVLTNVASPARARRALDRLRATHWGPFGSQLVEGGGCPVYGGPYVSPFMTWFEVAARAAVGDGEGAIELLRRTWLHQLERDPASTLWERFSPDGSEFGAFAGASGESKAHGWAAGPVMFGSEILAGVRPAAPGYERALLAPMLCGLSWIEAKVPTPRGAIEVTWEQTDSGVVGDVVVPNGTSCLTTVPGGSPTELGPGRHTVGSGRRSARAAAWDHRTSVTARPGGPPGEVAIGSPPAGNIIAVANRRHIHAGEVWWVASNDDVVVGASDDGTVAAYDPATGERLWVAALGEPIDHLGLGDVIAVTVRSGAVFHLTFDGARTGAGESAGAGGSEGVGA